MCARNRGDGAADNLRMQSGQTVASARSSRTPLVLDDAACLVPSVLGNCGGRRREDLSPTRWEWIQDVAVLVLELAVDSSGETCQLPWMKRVIDA